MSERRSSNVGASRKPCCKSSKRGCCGFLSFLCSKEKKAEDKDEYTMNVFDQHLRNVREHSGDADNKNRHTKTQRISSSPTGNSPIRPSFSKSEDLSPEEHSTTKKPTEEETGGNKTTGPSKKTGKARERPLIAVLTTDVPYEGSSSDAPKRFAHARVDITAIQNDWDRFCSAAKEELGKNNFGYAGLMPSDLEFTCLTVDSLRVRDGSVKESKHILTKENFLGVLQEYSYVSGPDQEVIVAVQQALPNQ